jgi:hypothetical protein
VPQGLLGAFLLGNLLHLLGIGTRGEEEKYESQAWRYTPVIPTVRRLKQEDKEFKASLDYRVRPERERERETERRRRRRRRRRRGQEGLHFPRG